jgi:hypothetical protein
MVHEILAIARSRDRDLYLETADQARIEWYPALGCTHIDRYFAPPGASLARQMEGWEGMPYPQSDTIQELQLAVSRTYSLVRIWPPSGTRSKLASSKPQGVGLTHARAHRL